MNINYEEIDELCRPMVKFFNEQGLITKFSCQGHDDILKNSFDIIFDKCITDDDIYNFINKYSNACKHTPFIGMFIKWMRKVDNKIECNWIYKISYGGYKNNQKFALKDLETMMNLNQR